jgi:hypothetical protein
LFRHPDCGHCIRYNDIYLKADKLGGNFNVPLRPPFRPANFDKKVLTIAPAEFAKASHKH